jgi:hypothetical protein
MVGSLDEVIGAHKVSGDVCKRTNDLIAEFYSGTNALMVAYRVEYAAENELQVTREKFGCFRILKCLTQYSFGWKVLNSAG